MLMNALQTLLVKTCELTLNNLQIQKPHADDKQQLEKVFAKLIKHFLGLD